MRKELTIYIQCDFQAQGFSKPEPDGSTGGETVFYSGSIVIGETGLQ